MRIYDHTGEIIGSWSVLEKIEGTNPRSYRCRCECGKESIVSTKYLNKLTCCHFCHHRKKIKAKIGDKHEKLTIIGFDRVAGRTIINIECECGYKYKIKNINQLKKTKSCFNCRRGYYPGKITGNCTLIKKIRKNYWEKKCNCGKLFLGCSRKTDCGCVAIQKRLEIAKKKIGNTYGYLKIKKIVPSDSGRITFLIKCKCGKTFTRVNGHEFKSYSCGCFNNLPIGEHAYRAILKNSDVISMRELYATGLYSKEQLSDMFKKEVRYISRILSKKIWKHV